MPTPAPSTDVYQEYRAYLNDMAYGFDKPKLKPRYGLIPNEPLEAVAKVLSFGATKYSDEGWKKILDTDKHYDSLMRHLMAWRKGDEQDEESGQPHLAHAITRLMFIMWLESRNNHDATITRQRPRITSTVEEAQCVPTDTISFSPGSLVSFSSATTLGSIGGTMPPSETETPLWPTPESSTTEQS